MTRRQFSRFLHKKREQHVEAGGFRTGLSLAMISVVLTSASAAVAQEDWPGSAWDRQAQTKKPAQSNVQPLRPMNAPPSFESLGQYGDPNSVPGGFSPSTNGSAQSFATPPSVDRADLSPLFPSHTPNTPSGPVFKAPQANGRTGNFRSTPSSALQTAGRVDPEIVSRILDDLEAPKSHTLRRLLANALASLAVDAGAQEDRLPESRLNALFRLGFLTEAAGFRIPASFNRGSSDWARLALTRSHAQVALNNSENACNDARDIIAQANALPKEDKHTAILISGYCGALTGNSAAATLAADVAREQSGFDPASLAALEAVAHSSQPRISSTTKLSPISYRLLQKAGAEPEQLISAKADTALLAAMSQDNKLPASARIQVTERAANDAVISVDALAKAYRGATGGADIEQMRSGRDAKTASPSERRAEMYVAAIRQQTPLRKVRLIRSFLDANRKSSSYQTALELMAKPVESLRPVPEIGWFAETAIEVLLISGRHRQAREWLQLAESADPRGPRALAHWAALIDIADWQRQTSRGQSLQSLEQMALRGDFLPDDLHRLATVLDALTYHVPIPLWEAASRTPQPTSGHLPATGLLSELQKASKSRDTTHTILLVLNAMGGNGPRGAHMIALGDSIRALKLVGLEKEARLLSLEALFPAWPRAPRG